MPFLSIFFAKLPIMAVELEVTRSVLAVDWGLFGITMTGSEFGVYYRVNCTRLLNSCQVFTI